MGVNAGLISVLLLGVIWSNVSATEQLNKKGIKLLDLVFTNHVMNDEPVSTECTDDEGCTPEQECAVDVDPKICKCREGRSGEDCMTINWCTNNEADCTVAGGTCEYSPGLKSGYCKCEKDADEKYDKDAKVCKPFCTDDAGCTPEQECAGDVDAKFCKCREGRSGEDCITIDWCTDNEADCTAAEGTCEYSLGLKSGYCKCENDPTEKYDKGGKVCKTPCTGTNEGSDCENDGICASTNGDNFCECKEGTSGDKCGTIDFCTTHGEACGKVGECKYNSKLEFGFCDCTETNKKYDLKLSICRETCTDDVDEGCVNGGVCEDKFCNCKAGTSGDKCKTIDWCSTYGDSCNKVGECKYSLELESGFCQCTDVNKKYDPEQKTCRETCKIEEGTSDCKHQASCTGTGDYFCVCLNGTSGDKCQIIDWCNIEANNAGCTASDRVCKYDVKAFTGFCDCKEVNKKYDKKQNKCREMCHEDQSGGSDCGHDGTCKENMCECPQGTSGDKCGTIDWCTTHGEACGKVGECKYDSGLKSGFCKCTDTNKKYDQDLSICRAPCSQNEDCKNGGTCDGEEPKFCKCPKGTSGELCDVIDWCTDNGENCQKAGGQCEYNPAKESGFCKCKNDLIYDKTKGACKVPCTGHDICENGGKCEGPDDDKFCQCPKGTSGHTCNVIDWCKDNGESCKNASGVCVYDLAKESGYCKCGDELKYDARDQTCKETCNTKTDCENEATCNTNNFCVCKTGTTGHKCEIVGWCVTNGKDCEKAEGECIYNPKSPFGLCRCKDQNAKYYIKDKQCRDDCHPNPCLHAGTCDIKNKKAVCNCVTPYKGDTCEISPCTVKPCKNNGKCKVTDNDFSCECGKGFAGKTCEIKCSCGDHMDCELDENNRQVCFCEKGYKEQAKEDQNEETKCIAENPCEEDPGICGEHGVCEYKGPGEHKCICNDTYTGEQCEEQFCDSSPCQNDGECENEAQGYACECKKAFEGVNCTDIKWCNTGKPCGELKLESGVTCALSGDSTTGYCKCEDERQYFDYKDKKCKAVDKCLAVSCDPEKICRDGACKCKDGYTETEEKKCIAAFCNKNSCITGSNCTDIEKQPGLVQCRCAKDTDIFVGNACKDMRCNLKDKPIGLKCTCPYNMNWKTETGDCVYKDEKNKCTKDCGLGWCMKRPASNDTCVCGDRYKNDENGKCILDPKKVCAGLDLVDDNSKCNCTGKYEQAEDGVTCERKTMCADEDIRDKCSQSKGKCVDNWASKDGYICECDEGYVKIDGICSDPCSQDEAKMKCMKDDKICAVNEKNAPVCRCPLSFGNEDNGRCDELAQYSYMLEKLHVKKENYYKKEGSVDFIKLNKDIILAMKQLFLNLEHAYLTQYEVVANNLNCKVELQFTSDPGYELHRVKLQSKTELNCTDCDEHALVLPPSLPLGASLDDVTVTKLDLCTTIVKNKHCGEDAECKENKCTCPTGYKNSDFGFKILTGATIRRCEDIDECAEGASCPEHSKCQNVAPGYYCKCNEGYRKEKTKVFELQPMDKAKCVEICDLKPCGAHGTCKRTGDTFDCSCHVGYGGSLCNREDANYKKAAKNTAIVGAILGTILGVVLIIFYITVKRLRKNSYSEDFSAPSNHQMELNGEMMERRPIRGISNKGYQ